MINEGQSSWNLKWDFTWQIYSIHKGQLYRTLLLVHDNILIRSVFNALSIVSDLVAAVLLC